MINEILNNTLENACSFFKETLSTQLCENISPTVAKVSTFAIFAIPALTLLTAASIKYCCKKNINATTTSTATVHPTPKKTLSQETLDQNLRRSARTNNIEKAKEALEAGANPESQDKEGNTALHYACKKLGENSKNPIDMAKLLIEHGAHLQTENKQGKRPRHHLCNSQQRIQLLDHEQRVNTKLLIKACEKNNVEKVEALIKYGVDVTIPHIIKKIDQYGLELSQEKKYPLVIAAKNPTIFNHLLQAGARLYVFKKDFPNFQHLKTDRINIELLYAAESGNLALVKHLIEKYQADPQAKDLIGYNALHYASWKDHLNIYQYLSQKDKTLKNAKNIAGQTPQSLAGSSILKHLGPKKQISKKALHHVRTPTAAERLLASNQANPNAQDAEGKTALIKQVSRCALTISKLLLKNKKVEINRQDKQGFTALHKAIEKGILSLVIALVQANIDLTLKDKKGRTALDYAKQKQKHCAVNLKWTYYKIIKCINSANNKRSHKTKTHQRKNADLLSTKKLKY